MLANHHGNVTQSKLTSDVGFANSMTVNSISELSRRKPYLSVGLKKIINESIPTYNNIYIHFLFFETLKIASI